MKHPTIKDIAELAGVNKCVVSHVMHNDAYASKIRPETRERILAIAEKIHYRRNQLASATRTGNVDTIAVILDFQRIQNFMPINQVFSGIMLETSRRGYSVKIFSEQTIADTFRKIQESRIDKIICLSVKKELREDVALHAEQDGLKLVFAYEHGHRTFPAVNVDNAEMTGIMVRHLAQCGHTRIGLLCVPHHYCYIADRHEGYLRGMQSCNLSVNPDWIHCQEAVEDAVDHILQLPAPERPTAFVALSDTVAARALTHLQRRACHVPEDFSIIGIGNTEMGLYTPVPLSTMDEHLVDSGVLLVRLLFNEIPECAPDLFHVYHTHAQIIERDTVFQYHQKGGEK